MSSSETRSFQSRIAGCAPRWDAAWSRPAATLPRPIEAGWVPWHTQYTSPTAPRRAVKQEPHPWASGTQHAARGTQRALLCDDGWWWRRRRRRRRPARTSTLGGCANADQTRTDETTRDDTRRDAPADTGPPRSTLSQEQPKRRTALRRNGAH